MPKLAASHHVKRALMILPPLLLLVYGVHSILAVRGLLSSSSSFHMEYADNLIEDYLELEMDLEIARLRQCLLRGDAACKEMELLTTEANGEPVAEIGEGRFAYFRHADLPQQLPAFFQRKKGLSSLYTERFHEPVYWFRILSPQNQVIYSSSQRPAPAPEGADNRQLFDMERTLTGYKLDIVYNSFGPKQLYSVAQNRINFGLIFFLFLMAVFSGILITYSIRQKLFLARQKSFFVTTVSHEFKTPLAIMKLAAETLAAKRFKSEQDEERFRNMLVNEVNRLNQLVHKILSFNRIETQQIHFHPQKVDLREAMKPSIEIFQARAIADKLELKVTCTDEPLPIEADPDLIRHAVDNILENAFKYRGDSTTIELTFERDGDQAAVSVRDYGLGIEQDEVVHITKSFYRIKTPTTEGIRGSGLGLAISKYILDRSKGKLSVTSQLGAGSTFTARFPLKG